MTLAALRNWLVHGRRGVAAMTAPGPGSVENAFATETRSTNPSQPDPPPAPGIDEPPRPPAHWTRARITAEEELWGTGYLTPGGAPEVLRFAAPIGLSAASTLLLLGAGAGGPAQTLATDLGVWVAGYESDEDLASLATRRIQRAGAALAKRATIATWDRHNPLLPRRTAHHALALDAIRDATPEPVLAAAAGALQPYGQFVILETVSPTPLDPADPAIAAWCRLEGRRPALPDPAAITLALGRLGFDVRVVEDMSARHMRLAVLGWKHLVRQMARERPSHERAAAVVTAAEMWTRRIRLMHAGGIRLMRWHAIGGGGSGPG